MIIKSLPRKQQSGRSIRTAINDLYSYITNGSDIQIPNIFHNLNLDKEAPPKEAIIMQFEKLIKKLPKHKARNSFYHEIISFKKNDFIPLKQQLDILRLTVNLYLQERARDNLAFASVHTDNKDHLHYHIILSANTYLNPEKRHALSKKEFSSIQKKLEIMLQEFFPKMNIESVYNKDEEKDYYRISNSEYGIKTRTEGKKTYRENIKDLLLNGFELSYDSKTFIDFLKRYKIRFYQRGKHVGIVFEGKKYRLNRLGLENKHQDFYESVIKFEQNLKMIQENNILSKEIPTNDLLSSQEKEYLKDLLDFISNNKEINLDFDLNQ